jgi:hypothetical protein
MRSWAVVVWVSVALVPIATGTHDQGCVPTAAEYYTEFIVNGELYYLIESEPLVVANTPVPGSGFLIGRGTWIYKEINGLLGPQQPGDDCKPFFPTPETLLYHLTHPCDPNFAEDCGHGSDEYVF